MNGHQTFIMRRKKLEVLIILSLTKKQKDILEGFLNTFTLHFAFFKN